MTSISIPRDLFDALRREGNAAEPYIEELHEKQLAIQKSPAKKKVAVCGRRAGKSRWLAAWFYEALELRPKERNIYMTTTRAKAREVLWDNGLSRLKDQFQLPIEITHEENQLIIKHENGARIWLLGVPDQGEIDKVRGGFYFRAAIDEAQAFPDWLETLVESALEPALLDLGGELALTGTPGAEDVGYFFEISTGVRPGWDSHHWTVLDNPYLPQGAAWLDEKRAYLGEDNPTFLREYMGLWVRDPEALVYPLTRDRNGWVPQTDLTPYGLPEGGYQFGLGIDLGWSERSTAFTLGAKPRGSGKLFFLRSWARSRLTPQGLGAVIQQVRVEVKGVAGCSVRAIVDEGALGGGFTGQLMEWGIMCEAAKKTEKRAHQEWMKGLILAGALQVNYSECMPLIEECRKLTIDPETLKESERYRNHNADSALYLTRALLPRYSPEEEMPEPGTTEHTEMQMRAEKARVAERLRKKREGKKYS